MRTSMPYEQPASPTTRYSKACSWPASSTPSTAWRTPSGYTSSCNSASSETETPQSVAREGDVVEGAGATDRAYGRVGPSQLHAGAASHNFGAAGRGCGVSPTFPDGDFRSHKKGGTAWYPAPDFSSS